MMGRPRIPFEADKFIDMVANGEPVSVAAGVVGISDATVYRRAKSDPDGFGVALAAAIRAGRTARLRVAHGSATQYGSGCRCAPCTKANAERYRTSKAKRLSAPVPVHVHGRNGYTNYDCRCEVCTAANSAQSQKLRDRRAHRSVPA